MFLTIATSIRVSPSFANAVASIPGLEKFVEMMQNDKGIQAIVDNEYYQPINVNQVKDNLTLTINGVILDETGMVVSYTLEGPYAIQEIKYESIDIIHNDERIEMDVSYYNDPNQSHENRKEDILKYYFAGKKTFQTQDFVLEIQLRNTEKTVFSVPFTIPNRVEEGRVYTLNEEVDVENQKMTIQDITIYPLRVEARIKFAETNSMRMYHFEDVRIENEKGEVWGRIENGSIGLGIGEEEQTIYLQSNYFEEPEKLYLKFDKIQALEKDEAYLLVDVYKQEVLKQPSVGGFEVMTVNADNVEVRFPKEADDVFGYFLLSGIENADGEDVNYQEQTMWQVDGYEYNSISLQGDNLKGPLKINFFAYPNYINGEVSVEIK